VRQVVHRAGLLDRQQQHVVSLADLLEDDRKIGSDQLIVYKSVGAAWEDLACARVVAGRLEDNKSREGL